MNTTEPLQVLDLFAGAGGLSTGLIFDIEDEALRYDCDVIAVEDLTDI